METKYQVSGRCPVCGDQMYVTRLQCEHCHSALEGQFMLGPFQKLGPEQLQFLEVFIRCRGQNKAIQELLDISYPTVNKKLDELILALGYESYEPKADQRREVLEMLSQNKITAAQAQQMLTGTAAPKVPENSEGRKRISVTGE